MQILIKAGRVCYGIMIAALAIQQIFYAEFRPVILPPWLPPGKGLAVFTYVASVALVLSGLAIIVDKKARTVSLVLGGIFLFIFCFCQVPYEILAGDYKHLGPWTSPLKELALSGGAFIIAGSYSIIAEDQQRPAILIFLEKIIPFGSVFFGIMLVLFGIEHFLYVEFVASLVPDWIPGHVFWTYFAGVALIGSGLAIILKVKLKLTAILLALMIFLWFIFLHIPRGLADPFGAKGNEISSVFESLGFSGIAYLIACGYHTIKRPKPSVRDYIGLHY